MRELLQAKDDIEFQRDMNRAKRFIRMFQKQSGVTIGSISLRKIDKYVKFFESIVVFQEDMRSIFESISDSQADSSVGVDYI